ncbi:MAG TPA: hypothetical protein EYM53_00155 [Gammaproteobacteria bacterium]|nr:hypothetical protein [Gammaproteobacteria bacterium]
MYLRKLSLSIVATIIAMPMASAHMHHTNMNHAAMMGHNTAPTQVVLTESGTDPFATLQEVIAVLESNPSTNWEKVNIEALRLHLVEMQDMTINVDVKQQHIDDGFQAVVTPTTNRVVKSLTRVLSGHPAQMKAETGWDMQVSDNNGVFTLTVTTDNAKDVAKIRGLGYIGVMAYGNHHQPHHWAIASGDNPHAGHNMKH